MRYLTDESCDVAAVTALRAAGEMDSKASGDLGARVGTAFVRAHRSLAKRGRNGSGLRVNGSELDPNSGEFRDQVLDASPWLGSSPGL